MKEKPIRIQQKRTRGWRKPENTVCVGRPTKWGNPFYVEDVLHYYDDDQIEAQSDCVRSFERHLKINADGIALAQKAKAELRGKNLACWCKIGTPCHADVLLKIANS